MTPLRFPLPGKSPFHHYPEMKLNPAFPLIVSLGLVPIISSCGDGGADAGGDPGAGGKAGVSEPLSQGEDWPTWGRDSTRNMVGNARNLPVEVNPGEMDDETEEIDLKTAKNIRWIAKLGSQSYGNVSVAQGRVFAGTNNDSPRDKRNVVDRGNLICLDEKTGEFLWQLIAPKHAALKASDWEYVGICSSPAIEEDRVWAVTNLGEVICLDMNGLANGNDGPFKDEQKYYGAGYAGLDKARDVTVEGETRTLSDEHATLVESLTKQIEGGLEGDALKAALSRRKSTFAEGAPRIDNTYADILWIFDMRDADKGVGAFPHNVSSCSPLVHGDILYTATSNGVDWSHTNIPGESVPGLIALDKNTGKLLGKEVSGVSERVLHASWSSPAIGKVKGRDMLIWGGGDGFAYGFDPIPVRDGERGAPILRELWRYDGNPPHYRHKEDGSPIKYATFKGPNEIIGTTVIHDGLVYIVTGQDPEHGDGVGMLSCLDPSGTGDLSGKAIWTYGYGDGSGIGRAISTPVITDDGLVICAEYDGDIHCVDAKTGKPCWVHETGSRVWASTLVADGKVYLGTEDGEVVILGATREKEHLGTIELHAPIYSSAVVANDTIYLASQTHLYAIGRPR
ncbi:MAG: pyrrolo-quinoline quinone [Roseibacillus sp.]|jgi:outer membrane protein assembly factor BamB|nr:pyrrolo-quinoline quinone [Roseibacillus sp.]MBI25190.1 pyrrolo-quinoline quinone [Roseibacillus sp.]MBP35970.1 pyrrolo-quinoline quinone [Roseibacillus sp.]|tara:strand:+ start:2102 stop:3970 length:1869 start_codon:yes stop_codon:yes gene_type:complete